MLDGHRVNPIRQLKHRFTNRVLVFGSIEPAEHVRTLAFLDRIELRRDSGKLVRGRRTLKLLAHEIRVTRQTSEILGCLEPAGIHLAFRVLPRERIIRHRRRFRIGLVQLAPEHVLLAPLVAYPHIGGWQSLNVGDFIHEVHATNHFERFDASAAPMVGILLLLVNQPDAADFLGAFQGTSLSEFSHADGLLVVEGGVFVDRDVLAHLSSAFQSLMAGISATSCSCSQATHSSARSRLT